MVNNARQFFADCCIEGRVDFIYGSATAVFDHCEIHSKNGGYVTAASTPQDHPFGFVFLHCKLTADDLARVESGTASLVSAGISPLLLSRHRSRRVDMVQSREPELDC